MPGKSAKICKTKVHEREEGGALGTGKGSCKHLYNLRKTRNF